VETGQALVEEFLASYAHGYTLERMRDRVHLDFTPSRSAFLKTLAAQAAARRILDYEVIVEQALPGRDALAVTFRWHRTAAERSTGRSEKASGIAEFVFRPEGGTWKLARAGGDLPF